VRSNVHSERSVKQSEGQCALTCGPKLCTPTCDAAFDGRRELSCGISYIADIVACFGPTATAYCSRSVI